MCLCRVAVVSHQELQLYPSIDLSHNFTRNGYPDFTHTSANDITRRVDAVFSFAIEFAEQDKIIDG